MSCFSNDPDDLLAWSKKLKPTTNEDAIQIIDDALQNIADQLKQNGFASIVVADVLLPTINEHFSECEIRSQPMLFNSTLLTIISPGAQTLNNRLTKRQSMTDNLNTDKVKKTRTPRDFKTIKAGALSLNLEERGELRDALIGSIKAEAGDLKAKAEIANKIANGTGS